LAEGGGQENVRWEFEAVHFCQRADGQLLDFRERQRGGSVHAPACRVGGISQVNPFGIGPQRAISADDWLPGRVDLAEGDTTGGSEQPD
jgi:hypothetical protein